MTTTDHLRELAEMFDGPNGWAEKAVWRNDVASALREAATTIDTLTMHMQAAAIWREQKMAENAALLTTIDTLTAERDKWAEDFLAEQKEHTATFTRMEKAEAAATGLRAENERLRKELRGIAESLGNVVERIKDGNDGALGALFLVAAANESKARSALSAPDEGPTPRTENRTEGNR